MVRAPTEGGGSVSAQEVTLLSQEARFALVQAPARAQKLRQLVRVLVPIFVTQVALSAVNVVDAMMSGRFSPVDLAGVAIGTNVWLPLSTCLTGVMSALTPVVAQLLGAGRTGEVRSAVFHGLCLAAAVALLLMAFVRAAIPSVLALMHLEPAVHEIARDYLFAISWGALPHLLYAVLRCFFDALGYTSVTMAITLASMPINVFFNYLLIFGAFGFPRLGGVGAGYASAVTFWAVFLIGAWVAARRPPFSAYQVLRWPRHGFRLEPARWKELLKLGVPIGLAILAEVSVFSGVGLLMSRFGTLAIAAHQAALSFASLLYMAPLSISMALTIVVGFEVGAGRFRDAVEYRRLGIAGALSFAALAATALTFGNGLIASLYTRDPELFELLRAFLHFAVFFQFFDALAAPIQGTLRGYKDVNAVLVVVLASFWCAGLPAGHLLAVFSPLGPFGYWIGLILGLLLGATGLLWRLGRTERAHALRAA